MDDILVSIVVPIYNVEDYLAECLNSLERQTMRSIEVILVNDGSTDNSRIISLEYEKRNSNFILADRTNGGLSAARNMGLDLARGEYVFFLDGDDFIADDAIEKLYNKSKKYNLDQLRFSAYTFENGTTDYKWTDDDIGGIYRYRGDYPDIYDGQEFYKKMISNNDYYPSCCLIFTRRSVIEMNKLRFYEGIIHEDNLFNFMLTTICDRVAILNEPLYYRRYRSGSITQKIDWISKNKAMCISAEETSAYIEAHTEMDIEIGKWQISYFLNCMFANWSQMTREDQDALETRNYFNRVKPLWKKYYYGDNKALHLFYMNYSLFKYYNSIKLLFKKRCGKDNE
ncbi:glycosyltransferase [Butyrivibrio sp. INlla16]|uniref:glycosyltransferase family 2 protein n=1 Tax=Butyrivibrio sp. INlla16 TaxID=1520807 RepID=UPI00088F69A2|nr:glycosyltransferase [Butyrivibrio sp. INlla16]SDB68208.1 Glycosyltransferase involved in cell wall bisynthesis [Butyrivibrio sp. INlla16]